MVASNGVTVVQRSLKKLENESVIIIQVYLTFHATTEIFIAQHLPLFCLCVKKKPLKTKVRFFESRQKK